MCSVRSLLILSAGVLAAGWGCGPERTSGGLEPIREAVAVRYVAREGAPLHRTPAEGAEVVHRFTAGESVSIMATRDQWSEIRFGDRTAWIRSGDLSDSPAVAEEARGSTTVKFRVAPSPVYSQGGARGEIILEANVAESGVVTDVRTLRNTTGSVPLEMQNRRELLRATFYPLLVNGKPKAFIYEYRVSY
jgi:uncharacterized protein YgiM (DUF1202 family)